jgi:hypothetical protein
MLCAVHPATVLLHHQNTNAATIVRCRVFDTNNFTGMVPALKFDQYSNFCCLQSNSGTNHFDCPLPLVSVRSQCWVLGVIMLTLSAHRGLTSAMTVVPSLALLPSSPHLFQHLCSRLLHHQLQLSSALKTRAFQKHLAYQSKTAKPCVHHQWICMCAMLATARPLLLACHRPFARLLATEDTTVPLL